MNNPLHASCFADDAVVESVEILQNEPIAKDTFRLRFRLPELAAKITPGQFLMLRLAEGSDPLIGRPLALYDTHDDQQGRPAEVEVVYLVHGKLTSRLAQCRLGRKLDIWGPLGNGFSNGGFSNGGAKHLIMVAGGIGQTPFLSLARQRLGLRRYGNQPLAKADGVRVTFCYGARTAAYLAGIDDFKRLGVDVLVSTDDGSQGRHGLVTELLEKVLRQSAAGKQPNCEVVCCGPEPMMKAVAKVAAARQTPCRVSLETPMACGIGVCFTCVAKVRDATGTWDYKRTCVEGPVFNAADIVW